MMTIKDTFTDEEWFLLSSSPAMIGAAVSGVSPSGVIGTVKEMTASMRASVEGLTDFPDSELIAALLEKAQNWDEANEKIQDYREKSKAKLADANVTSTQELRAQVLLDCAAVAKLVDERCSKAEAAAYKEWSVKLAHRVAEAAKEGSVLGFGGERVTDAERQMIADVESALGAPAGHLLA